MYIEMPSIIRKFIQFIHEEFTESELIQKIKKSAPIEKNIRLPFYLEDHSILAFADNFDNNKIFAELVVNGNNICLEYGDNLGTHDTLYSFHDYKDLTEMITVAYNAWKDKLKELNLSEEDISIDEFAK